MQPSYHWFRYSVGDVPSVGLVQRNSDIWHARCDAQGRKEPLLSETSNRALSLLTFLLVVASGTGLSTHPARGQEEPAERFAEEVVVTEVLLDAVVTDKSGRVILGLGKDDFIVLENGREMEIAGVTFYSSAERQGSAALDLPGFDLSDIPENRSFILFIQELSGGSLRTLRLRMQRAGDALRDWVTTKLDPADEVAVVSYGYKLEVHQDFTSDRAALTRAVDRAVRGADPDKQWPSRRPPEAAVGPLLGSLPAGKELRRRTKSIYSGLKLLAEAASTVPGRKNLVFVGPGFDPLRSAEYQRMRPTLQALNDANIAAYTIDLVPAHVQHSSRASLQKLAHATGGDFFYNFVRFETPLERIAAGTSGYYLIAYRSEHPAGEAGYQRVEVELVNPQFRVRARSGYAWGDSNPSEQRDSAPPQ